MNKEIVEIRTKYTPKKVMAKRMKFLREHLPDITGTREIRRIAIEKVQPSYREALEQRELIREDVRKSINQTLTVERDLMKKSKGWRKALLNRQIRKAEEEVKARNEQMDILREELGIGDNGLGDNYQISVNELPPFLQRRQK